MSKTYLVDPFIPVRPAPRRKLPATQPSVQGLRKPQQAAGQAAQAREHPNARTSMLQKFQLPLVIFGAVLVGLLIQSLVFGELAIAVYAIFAVTRRIASRTTFLLALIAFLSIVLLLLAGNSTLATNFAVYAFLLLVVGTISLGTEVHRGNTGRL